VTCRPRTAADGRLDACPSRRVRGEAGFTLIEVLITVAVIGFIILLLGQGVQFVLMASSHQTRMLTGEGNLESVDRVLRRLIRRIDAAGMHATAPEFIGTAHTLAFVGVLPDPFPGLASREADMTLAVRPPGALELSWRPHYRHPAGPAAATSRQDLLTGVSRLDLAYLAADGAWHARWSGTSLPRLIRIRLVLTGDTSHRWPDIIIAPMRDSWRP
jgi:prepilin-type N-terminal cleavage/methylation domain-containing protein